MPFIEIVNFIHRIPSQGDNKGKEHGHSGYKYLLLIIPSAKKIESDSITDIINKNSNVEHHFEKTLMQFRVQRKFLFLNREYVY